MAFPLDWRDMAWVDKIWEENDLVLEISFAYYIIHINA